MILFYEYMSKSKESANDNLAKDSAIGSNSNGRIEQLRGEPNCGRKSANANSTSSVTRTTTKYI